MLLPLGSSVSASRPVRFAVRLLLFGVLPGAALAQSFWAACPGDFVPTADILLDTTANGGRFDFVEVHIPSGVTVTVAGTHALRLFAAGSIVVDGALLANGADGSVPAGGGTVAGGIRGGDGGSPGV